jgi:transcriptional regulator with XRE-family HTH domain
MVTVFGKFLRKLRVDRELTLRDMATSLGISSAYLSAMELGKRTIQPQLADKIAAIYGVPCDQEIKLSEKI